MLVQRGITSAAEARAFLDPAQYPPAPPGELPDLLRAAALLSGYLTTQRSVLVWGDFDVDGQTATSLLLDGLRGLGAQVTWHIPHRVTDSHGIGVERLAALIAERNPALLLTCDTGVSAHAAIEYANAQGVTVIVTDHHDLPPELPPAAAVVNPRRLPPEHPLRDLPGVGVAYRLMQALYQQAGREAELPRLLDLVALGIVADVARQTHDTRYLLQLGLVELRRTQRAGLRALIDVAGLDDAHLSAEDIGFQLGPRLNAAGRLDDAAQAVELLTTSDPTQARVLAANLDGLNQKRRVLQQQIFTAANTQIANQPELLDHAALVLAYPEWHPGLLGIVAGQLAEMYQRPCVLLRTTEDGPARGSARSAPGYDIGQAIAAQADLLIEYGGHPGAAGLSLPAENIKTFRRRLSHTLHEQAPAATAPPLEIAAEVGLDEINAALLTEIDRLAPFGEGNPPIVLATRNLTLVSDATIGRDRRHRRLTVQDDAGRTQAVLWWKGAEHRLPEGRFDLAYTLGWNTYQGRRDLTVTLEDYRLQDAVTLAAQPAVEQIVEDWRDRPLAEAVAAFRQQEPVGIIWAEGAGAAEIDGLTRDRLHRAPALLIATAPPASHVLCEALEQVQAERLYVLAALPPDQQAQPFLRRLLGLCKYTINHLAGHADLHRLSAATAQTNET
ncbi:MAG: single-stranded-DNA-specific exonuclease RecJ, partial [Anaerolineae bacterium]|nr:single-stranded-DNA-specific exonuclease RecJ [Anaerolineae bacterium]